MTFRQKHICCKTHGIAVDGWIRVGSEKFRNVLIKENLVNT